MLHVVFCFFLFKSRVGADTQTEKKMKKKIDLRLPLVMKIHFNNIYTHIFFFFWYFELLHFEKKSRKIPE